ncbi:hypothetical protein GCK32_020098, partial [Trichostrongylus colubriformis]
MRNFVRYPELEGLLPAPPQKLPIYIKKINPQNRLCDLKCFHFRCCNIGYFKSVGIGSLEITRADLKVVYVECGYNFEGCHCTMNWHTDTKP